MAQTEEMKVDTCGSNRERILVVDDDELNIQIFEEILGDDYCLRCVSDGASALTEALRFRPGLVLLDVMMPGLNGYETARSMRELPELRYVKIILVSAKAMLTDRLKGYEAGADDYITKPFDHDELVAKVRVFLRLKTAEEVERLQSEFLTILGHQFRTPLTHVLGAAEMLSSGTARDADARQELTDSILVGARRMKWLLDYLNHFHAMRVGRVAAAVRPVPLLEVVREVMDDLTATAERKGVALALDAPSKTDTVADRLHTGFVLRTLIGEAIEASPEGDVVRVAMGCEGAAALLSISDRRVAIDRVHQHRIFDLMWVQNVRHHGGDISSLPLAREISRQCGGDIRLEESTAEGTRFVLRVPMREIAGAADRPGAVEGTERAA
jgi:two-component system, sensor histidine kinase and response regulator